MLVLFSTAERITVNESGNAGAVSPPPERLYAFSIAVFPLPCARCHFTVFANGTPRNRCDAERCSGIQGFRYWGVVPPIDRQSAGFPARGSRSVNEPSVRVKKAGERPSPDAARPGWVNECHRCRPVPECGEA